jgi:RNA polymerase sigma factor (sigma-70 family)
MVKQAASRDVSDARAAFEGEVLPHADRLFRLAMWFVRNRADAEDVVQDTMMQALKSFHRFQPGTNCRAWLTTILQRIVSNRRRAAGRSIVVDDPDDRIAQTVPFVPPVPQELTDELVLGTLGRLPTTFDSHRDGDVAAASRPRSAASGARGCGRTAGRPVDR